MSAEETIRRVTPSRTSVSAPWRLHIDRRLCLGPPEGKHLSGGACVAAMLAALEAETGKPLIQANAQFLAAPPAGVTASIATELVLAGRNIVQARACLHGPNGEAASITCSLGARVESMVFGWRTPPNAPPPEACKRIPFVREDEDDLHTHLDMRIANDPHTDRHGRLVFWVKAPNDLAPVASVLLALIADYVPEAIHFNIGRPAGAVSLDNSIRVIDRAPTEWLLCETRLAGLAHGLFHGEMSIFTREGALLALATQSGVVRVHE